MKKRRLLSLALSGALALSLASPALAAPAGSGIAVQLDGKKLTFTDAAPQARDGRTFLPFRAVFEAMGATVDYDAAANAVSATRGGTTVTMTLGSTQAAVVSGGEETALTMDVAPFAENSRTYVPVRFAAQALGCAVGWDQDDQTVILLDGETLVGQYLAGDDFSLYRQYLSHDLSTLEGRQAITAHTSIDTGGQFQLDCVLNGLRSGDGLSFTGDGSLDLSSYYEMMAAQYNTTPEVLGVTKADMVSKMAVEVCAGGDAYYLRSSELENTLDGLPADAWVSFDSLEELRSTAGTAVPGTELIIKLAAMPEGWNSLMKFELAPTLQGLMGTLSLDDKDTALADAMALIEEYAAPFRDSALVKMDNGYTATLTHEQEGAPFTVQVDLFCDQNGAVTGYQTAVRNSVVQYSNGSLGYEDFVTSYRDGTITLQDVVTNGDGTKDTISISLSFQPTAVAPQTAPPAGDAVVPYSQLTPKA